MEKISIYDKKERLVGVINRAFNVEKTEELMREYTLSFSVTNQDHTFKYINEESIFGFGGQLFDVAGIDGDSGDNNITQITAEHISYRLSDYTLPNGYSFVGTVAEIAQDILNQAKTVKGVPASSAFSIGYTVDLGTVSFGMAGQTNVTAREALIAMSALGVEINFDNFVVNVPQRIGSDSVLTFEYGVNLKGVHRTWQRGNGWSYEIKIADIAKAGRSGYEIHLGDSVVVKDTITGTEIQNRVISYVECDDPSKNTITVGVFVRDNASMTVRTDKIANNSVQQATKYNNVSIDHENGFMSVNRAGTIRAIMNGEDCFAVQVLKNGVWETVNSMEEFGLLINRLTSQDAKDSFYIKVGDVYSQVYGLQFFADNTNVMNIVYVNSSSAALIDVINNLEIKAGRDIDIDGRQMYIYANSINVNNKNGKSGTGITGSRAVALEDGQGHTVIGTIKFVNGICTQFVDI